MSNEYILRLAHLGLAAEAMACEFGYASFDAMAERHRDRWCDLAFR